MTITLETAADEIRIALKQATQGLVERDLMAEMIVLGCGEYSFADHYRGFIVGFWGDVV